MHQGSQTHILQKKIGFILGVSRHSRTRVCQLKEQENLGLVEKRILSLKSFYELLSP